MQCLAAGPADKVDTFAKDAAYTGKVPNMNTHHFHIALGNLKKAADCLAVLINGFCIGYKEITVCDFSPSSLTDNGHITCAAECQTAAFAAKIQFDRIVQSKRTCHRNLRRQGDGRILGLQSIFQFFKCRNLHRRICRRICNRSRKRIRRIVLHRFRRIAVCHIQRITNHNDRFLSKGRDSKDTHAQSQDQNYRNEFRYCFHICSPSLS